MCLEPGRNGQVLLFFELVGVSSTKVVMTLQVSLTF